MRYLGSKTSLLDEIYKIVSDICPSGLFCDAFGGIGTVGAYFKGKGYKVVTGDILHFAHCFQVARIVLNGVPSFSRLKEYLHTPNIEQYINLLEPHEGWLTSEYADKRLYFQHDNSKKIQSCIDFIWNIYHESLVSEQEYCFLISSLIDSMDRVANTAGTYYAHLKNLTHKANKQFHFAFLKPAIGNDACESYLRDAIELTKTYVYDFLYLDPPYNERNYQRYYHLPENLAIQSIPQPIENKSGIYIEDKQLSAFNTKSGALDSFKDIIISGTYKYLIFHYTDSGLIPVDFIRSTLAQIGRVDEYYFNCRAYSTRSTARCAQHHIFSVARNLE